MVFDPNIHPDRDLTSEELKHFLHRERKARYDYTRNTYRFLVNNQEVVITDIFEYCRQNNLDRNKLFDTYRKNKKPYAGHISLLSPEITKAQLNYKGRKVHFAIDREGKIIKIDNLRKYCKQNMIDRGVFKKTLIRNVFYNELMLIKLSVFEADINMAEIEKLAEDKRKLINNCNYL